MMAISFVAPFAPRPVLSPTLHVFGTPARIIDPPVSLRCNQSSSLRRDASDKAWPSNSLCMSEEIAAGVVVSRSSPGMALFNSGSIRSRRVTRSPRARTKFVTPAGPPIAFRRRLPGCIIALFDRRFAQRAQDHPALVEMFLCHRRIFQDVFRAVGHEPFQFFLFLIDALQHGRGREKFERAAHRESLLRPIIEMFVVAGIDRGHTDSAADSCLYRCNPGCRIIFPRLHLPPGRLATEKLLPSVVGGMAFFHRDENTATRCTDFSTSGECSFNGRAIIC